jgi:hypothetical protein
MFGGGDKFLFEKSKRHAPAANICRGNFMHLFAHKTLGV